MSRKVIIAGNWKMNKLPAEGAELAKGILAALKDFDFSQAEVVVCPTLTTLPAVAAELKGSRIKVGAQNVHWAASGAFTGEVSAEMLKAIGAEYVIIGHSERRQYFGETDETVNQRLKAALNAGLRPIVCIGELKEERQNGTTEQVLTKQIEGGFKDLTAEELSRVVVAYEPVWAIGTGLTATPDIAEATHKFIRAKFAELFGAAAAEKLQIQYGGSMKPENARELVACPDIDGGLIGGAALKADSFVKLINEAVAR